MKSIDVENLCKAFTLRLLTKEDLIQWADKQIVELEEPPYWLIELSLSQALHIYDVEKLLFQNIPNCIVSDSEFLGAMAYRHIKKHEPLTSILSALFDRFCLVDWVEMTDIRQEIYLIDDELDWNKKQAAKRALSFLTPYLDCSICYLLDD